VSRSEHFYPEIDWYGDSRAENVVGWLPAFGDSGTMTARPYIEQLNQQGWSVMVTNHHRSGYRMSDTRDEVLRHLLQASRERVLLAGASFGAQAMAEVLRSVTPNSHAAQLHGRFSAISICGVSGGQDTLKPIGWSKQIHGPVSGGIFKLGQAIQIMTGSDSPFDEDDPKVGASIKPHQRFRKWHFTGRALLEQMYAMATTPPVFDGEFAGIPALILTTEGDDHLLKAQAANNLLRAFSNGRLEYVDLSIHCDLTELPSQYGPFIWDFADRIISSPVSSR